MPLQYVKNKRNNDELFLDSFLYQHRSRPGTVGKEWRCRENRSIHQCPAACRTDNDMVIKHWGEHNHPAPTEGAISVKIAISETRKRAREESTPLQQIFNNEISKRVKKGSNIDEIAACKIKYVNHKKNLNKIRRQDTPSLPKRVQQVILTWIYMITNYSSRFLLFDTGDKPNRMIAFASDIGLEIFVI